MAWFNWMALGHLQADAGEAFEKVLRHMEVIVPAVFELSRARAIPPHEAAVEIAERNLARMQEQFGGDSIGALALKPPASAPDVSPAG
jgi:glutamate dehydrogenase (NAD(P)+)